MFIVASIRSMNILLNGKKVARMFEENATKQAFNRIYYQKYKKTANESLP